MPKQFCSVTDVVKDDYVETGRIVANDDEQVKWCSGSLATYDSVLQNCCMPSSTDTIRPQKLKHPSQSYSSSALLWRYVRARTGSQHTFSIDAMKGSCWRTEQGERIAELQILQFRKVQFEAS